MRYCLLLIPFRLQSDLDVDDDPDPAVALYCILLRRSDWIDVKEGREWCRPVDITDAALQRKATTRGKEQRNDDETKIVCSEY